jgi:hypothetical protein
MKRLVVAAILAITILAVPAVTLAAQPDDPSCWGQVTRQFAGSYPGAMGEHASGQSSPRAGIGNVAELFTGTHQPGELGALLGSFIGLSCD